MQLMPEFAYLEATADGNPYREAKAGRFVRSRSGRISPEAHELYASIERAIFPRGVATAGQANDVEIVYEATIGRYILVTTDGASRRQPRGILGARAELAALGGLVMRPAEAVEHVRDRIRQRDARIEQLCAAYAKPIPHWVGND
jgi:hypothetical protein